MANAIYAVLAGVKEEIIAEARKRYPGIISVRRETLEYLEEDVDPDCRFCVRFLYDAEIDHLSVVPNIMKGSNNG